MTWINRLKKASQRGAGKSGAEQTAGENTETSDTEKTVAEEGEGEDEMEDDGSIIAVSHDEADILSYAAELRAEALGKIVADDSRDVHIKENFGKEAGGGRGDGGGSGLGAGWVVANISRGGGGRGGGPVRKVGKEQAITSAARDMVEEVQVTVENEGIPDMNTADGVATGGEVDKMGNAGEAENAETADAAGAAGAAGDALEDSAKEVENDDSDSHSETHIPPAAAMAILLSSLSSSAMAITSDEDSERDDDDECTSRSLRVYKVRMSALNLQVVDACKLND